MKNKISELVSLYLSMFGSLFIGLVTHELYHVLTLSTVSMIGIGFGTKGVFFVSGTGNSSEIIAWCITIIITILGTIFAIRKYH